jgi:4-hydroxy-3-methylbut-2-en-1-yl diphosphate reductase
MSAFEYHRKGFGLRSEVRDAVSADYESRLVDLVRERDNRLEANDLTIRLASEFGFCYGVHRAVKMAYETRTRFPDHRIYLSGQIIHNPDVNGRLRDMGIAFLEGKGAGRFAIVEPGDVVIVPAFGCTHGEFELLEEKQAVVVDTTCGSVLSVWKNVERYARTGFTALIHGKYTHEETRATCSRAVMFPGGRYVVVRDREETKILCDAIEGCIDAEEFLTRLGHAVSPDFDPEADLRKIGCANQTTMLSTESLVLDNLVREALIRRHGEDGIGDRFIGFTTVCRATQDRQNAVRTLIAEKPDLMIVGGGYNSSNTGHLAALAAEACTTYHVDRTECLVSADEIHHRPVGEATEIMTRGWLPEGPVTVGIAAGASTPNRTVGGLLERLLLFRGIDLDTL